MRHAHHSDDVRLEHVPKALGVQALDRETAAEDSRVGDLRIVVYTVEPGSESERNLDLLRVIGLQPPSDAGSAADGSLSAEYSARTGASTR